MDSTVSFPSTEANSKATQHKTGSHSVREYVLQQMVSDLEGMVFTILRRYSCTRFFFDRQGSVDVYDNIQNWRVTYRKMHISICTRYQLHAHTYVGISSMSSIHSTVNVFTTQYGEYLHSIHSIDKLAAVSPRRQSQVAETSWKCIMEEKYCHNIVAQNWRKRETEIRVRYSPKV